MFRFKKESNILNRSSLPEYEQVFSDIFSMSLTKVLLHSPLPKDLLNIDIQKLADLLNQLSKACTVKLGLLQKLIKSMKVRWTHFVSPFVLMCLSCNST